MNASAKPVIAAIEAGGTKVQVAVGTEWDPSAYLKLQTTNDPIETMVQVLAAIDQCAAGRAIDGIGIASFGPIDVNPQSSQYGVIGVTPKKGWQGFDYRGFFVSHLEAPVAIDTDVNAAALAEYHMGNHATQGGLAYATIGTGIGVGIARELLKLGATVVIASRKAENIDPAVAGLRAELGVQSIHGATCDIRDRDAVRTLVDQVLADHGRIDIV